MSPNNPSHAVLDAHPWGHLPLGRISLPYRTAVLLTAASMLALTAIQEPLGWSWLAWVALLPWVIATVGSRKDRPIALISYILGLAYFLGNLYWLVGVTPLGYVALCFYLAWYWPLTGFLLRRIYLGPRWPFTFVLPVVWVAQEYLRAIIFTGFPWLLLGHSQHQHLRLIQLCDLFGVYGLTFLIAMVNGLFCDLLLRPLRSPSPRARRSYLKPSTLVVTVLVLLAAALGYGHYRLRQGRRTIQPGPTLAVIQENIPQYVKERGDSDEDIFTRHLALSTRAWQSSPRPNLIVWPETMVPGPLNRRFLDLVVPPGEQDRFRVLLDSQSYDRRLRALAARGVALLVGAPSVEFLPSGAMRRFNSAFLYLPGGTRDPQRYDKMHLVPFGEAVPFRHTWPWLHRLLNSLTPYDYEYTLDAGTRPTRFQLQPPGKPSFRFAVAICYEDVMPPVARRLARPDDGRKRIDFLLNISNDGWFVRGGQRRPITPTSELIQHWVICHFRAVENRLGIARAVNTGISGFIRPDGQSQPAGRAGNLPPQPNQRQAVAGFLTDTIMIDSRVSPYSRIGDIFALACTLAAGLLLLYVLLARPKK